MNEYNLHFNLSLSQLYDTWPWVWFSAVWCMYDACVICNVEKFNNWDRSIQMTYWHHLLPALNSSQYDTRDAWYYNFENNIYDIVFTETIVMWYDTLYAQLSLLHMKLTQFYFTKLLESYGHRHTMSIAIYLWLWISHIKCN